MPIRASQAVGLGFSTATRPSLGTSGPRLGPGPGVDGTWSGRGRQLSALGKWSVEVLVQEQADAVVALLTVVVTE